MRSANDAALYEGKEIWVLKAHLPELEEEEWYHYQLLGMPVHDQLGAFVGTVTEVVQSTTDILIIDGDHRCYVPFVQEHVISISLQNGIVITPRNV